MFVVAVEHWMWCTVTHIASADVPPEVLSIVRVLLPCFKKGWVCSVEIIWKWKCNFFFFFVFVTSHHLIKIRTREEGYVASIILSKPAQGIYQRTCCKWPPGHQEAPKSTSLTIHNIDFKRTCVVKFSFSSEMRLITVFKWSNKLCTLNVH